MKFGKVLRSTLALFLILASLVSIVPTVAVSAAREEEERLQVTLNMNDIEDAVAELDENGEMTEEESLKAYEDALAAQLMEQYGLELADPDYDPEIGTWEDISGGPAAEKPQTKDDAWGSNGSGTYVFIDLKPGGSSRNFNWQVKSDDTTNHYFSANIQGCIAGYYKGTDARLYMPMETGDYINGRLGQYVLKAGDIARVRVQSISANGIFTEGGTAKHPSYFAVHTSGKSLAWQTFGDNQQLTWKSDAEQTLTWTMYSSLAGQTLRGVRWDPSQDNLTESTRIYIDYIYIGPADKAPVLVQYRNANNSGNLGYQYVGYGKKANTFSTGKTNSSTSTTQTIWGWQVWEQRNGTWTDLNKFITDPSTYTCYYNTRFILKEVTIRKQSLSSSQIYNTGASADDDKYTLTVEGFDTAEISSGLHGTPIDVAILLDRSGSQADLVTNHKCNTYAQVETKLDTLGKNCEPGYYRATCFRQNSNDQTGKSGWQVYLYTMPMRYYRGEWQMQVLSSCNCNGSGSSASHRSYGIYIWNSTGQKQCSHVKWVDMETGFNNFKTCASNTGYTVGSSTRNGETLQFNFGASRLGRCQNALRTFMASLYNSSNGLPADQTHTVSVLGFGGTIFAANYPYSNGNGGYATSSNYSSCTRVSTAVTIGNYQSIVNTIWNTYVYGATRTDCAFQVLTGTQSAIEKSAGKSKATLTKTDYLPNATSGRKRVVVLVTDGAPSSSLDFDSTVATAAIAASKTLKANSSTTVYAIATMSGLDDTKYYSTSNSNANNFMNLVSSRYPQATAYNAAGSKTVTGTYYIADTASGSELATALSNIWKDTDPTVAHSSMTGPGSLWLVEKFSREWKPDPSKKLRVLAAPYTTNGTFGTPVCIGEHAITLPAAGSKTTINGNGYTLYVEAFSDQSFSYSLKWTDAKKSYLRETDLNLGSAAKAISGTLNTAKGYKIQMEMPVEVDRNNTLGGNNIPLTVNTSGCYQASSSADTAIGTKLYSYTIPNANVFCSVEADPHDYFISMEDYAALMNSTSTTKLKTILDGMIRMPDNLKPANDNGLSNLDYVSFDVQLKAPNGTVMLRKAAALGGTSFTSNVNNVADSLVDLTKDQTFTMVSSMTFKNSSKDSFGRAAYPNVNATYTPTYYVPKFAVVDYDGNISVDLGSVEGADASKITGISNGATFASGKLTCSVPSFMSGSDNTISYTYNTKYAPSGTTSTSIARKVYLIPANVMTYDDSRIGFETGWSDSGTKSVLTQSFDNTKHHGYDDNYASTGNYHGSTKYATVNSKNSTAYGYFTFTGTGLEIVSRCSPDSGVLMAEIYSGTECVKDNLKKSILCNTYLNTATYEQSPIIRWEGEFGTYTVRLTAYYNVAFAVQKSKDALTEEDVRAILGYDDSVDFTYIPSEAAPTRAIRASYTAYVDAVRIFNSAGTSETVKYAYSLAGEPVVADFTDLRSQIMDVGNWNGSAATGMLYIADTKVNTDSDDTTTDTVEGFPLLMDDSVNIEKVEVTGAYGTKEMRTYYLDRNNKRFKDPTTGKEIWSMFTSNGAYYYYIENPTPTANAPYKTLSRARVREILGTDFMYYNSSYYSYGPKFEIYLSKNNGVAFSASGSKVYLSLRSVDGAACTVQAYNGSSWVTVVSNLTSKTEQFFDFTTYKGNVILRNTGSGILSIAQAKTIGATKGVYVDKNVAFAASYAFETPVDAVVSEDLKLSHSLNLRSDIGINYIVRKDVLAEYESYTFVCEMAGKTYYLSGVENGEYIYFTLDQLTAAMMNENISATLTAYKGEEAFVSPQDDYSIATYAYTMLNRERIPDSFRQLCANLLRYGSATQIYLDYNADALADEEMTEEQRAYLTDLETVTFGAPYQVLNDLSLPVVTWYGRTLLLDSTVSIRLAVDASDYVGSGEDLELRATYTDLDGNKQTITVAAQAYEGKEGLYLFTIDQLNAADLRAVLRCRVYAKGEAVSQTMTYSADSYGNGKTGTLLTLCQALFAYVDSVKAYFG